MRKADMVLYNGQIHTMVSDSVVSATAVKDGRIVAVGSVAEILALCGEDTEKIDLAGDCTLPGFNDSHCHLRLTGEGFSKLDLRGVKETAAKLAG